MTSRRIIWTSWLTTAAFVVSAVAATVWEDARPYALVAALVLFAVGIAAFAWALVVAAARSREVEIGMGGLFFLRGSAPSGVERSLLAALGVQVVVALVTAGIRPYTSLAFGVLVPTCGLGLAGLWGARHGQFEPRR